VLRPFTADQTQIQECGTRLKCLEQGLGNLAASYGPEAAWGTFDTLVSEGIIDPATCHLSSHKIASGAMIWAKGDLPRVFAAERQDCVGGYLHGVLSELFVGLSSRDAGEISVRAVEVCVDTYQWPDTFKMLDCAHGSGHAMLQHTGYDLPLSLRACELAFPENSGIRDREESRLTCVNGVFMEHFFPSYDVVGKWLDDNDPFVFCRALEDDPALAGYGGGVVTSCWIHSTYSLARIYLQRGDNLDIAGFARACDTLERVPLVNCYIGLGRELSVERDPALLANACGMGRAGGGEVACIFYGAFSFTNSLARIVPDFGVDARALCGRMTREDTIEACWRSFGHYIAYNATIIPGRTDRERVRILWCHRAGRWNFARAQLGESRTIRGSRWEIGSEAACSAPPASHASTAPCTPDHTGCACKTAGRRQICTRRDEYR
jgi:hypothetical protein